MEIFAHNGIQHQSVAEGLLHRANDILPVIAAVLVAIGLVYGVSKFVLAKEHIKIKREK